MQSAGASLTVPPLRSRLTRRGRLIITVLLLTLIVPVVSAAADVVKQPQPVEVVLHVVAPGETLWEIAQATKPPGKGIWDEITNIKRLNDLPTSALSTGQTILLPAR